MNNEYRLSGTYRKTGSIGLPDKFKITKTAETAETAMDEVRLAFYQDGYEHILFVECKENGVQISMLKALGLE